MALHLRSRFSLSPRYASVSRAFVSSAQGTTSIPLCLNIWGANTDVGKTVFSAGLLRVCSSPAAYVKPVQTGYPAQDDSAVVHTNAKNASVFTLYTYQDPVSPDLAARSCSSAANPPLSDRALCQRATETIHTFVADLNGAPNQTLRTSTKPRESDDEPLLLLETAGGVLSPAPSGTPQADVYRPLRMQSILVADTTLGGISTTLAAFEALRNRGYDVPAVVFIPQPEVPDSSAAVAGSNSVSPATLDNESSVDAALSTLPATTVFRAPPLPPLDVPLDHYFRDPATDEFFTALLAHLRASEAERLTALATLSDTARNAFWYPFTQHASLGNILTIDSAHGDNYVVAIKNKQDPTLTKTPKLLRTKPTKATTASATASERQPVAPVMTSPVYNAAGSWWTNGVGHGNQRVSAAIAAASARYGHVIFPEAVHAPAAELATRLLQGVGRGWASRVFYSDNGSTAIEVALKMAFRKRAKDYPDRASLPVHIVGAVDSYHGDTLGTMQCSEESDFNKLQTPWYEARGLFFDQPTVALRDGLWTISGTSWMQGGNEELVTFASRDEVFNIDRVEPHCHQYISATLDAVLEKREIDLGALVIEPVVMGAGGMHIIDPAFQRALVKECRARGIPIVFDEIFSGLWRLGAQSAAELLGCVPDIAAFGKLLTGGTVPLSATLATEEIKSAFDGESKREALLHGHSYTAHAIGCAAGVESLRIYDELVAHGREYWCENFSRELSSMERVQRVSVLGTVLAVELKAEQGGYAATGAADWVEKLAHEGICIRPLGNVIYLLCTPLTEKDVCDEKMRALVRVLDDGADSAKLAEAKE